MAGMSLDWTSGQVAFSAFFVLFAADAWLHGPVQGPARHAALAVSVTAAVAGRYEAFLAAQFVWLAVLAFAGSPTSLKKASAAPAAGAEAQAKTATKSKREGLDPATGTSALPAQGKKLIEDSLSKFVKNLDPVHSCDGKTWQLEQDKDGIKVFSAAFPGQSTKRWKVTCTCRAESLHELCEELFNFDKRTGASGWDTALKTGNIVKTFGEHFTVARMITNAAAGGAISSREFFDLRVRYNGPSEYKFAPENGCLTATVGLDPKKDKSWLPSMPKPDKNYVVGTSYPGGGVRISALGKDTFLYEMVTNMNLNGWIPTSVINTATSSALLESHQAMLAHLDKKFA
ncbi:StAR-related lipid transfer protein 3 [Hondaea fermentalgiana]|uniref:StAR-related lipid transfer protein 3 n=1 Tax=Hondaea fermentalgiana TaxID=2315210 RepID=A0A2R5GX60_9STRA|nr:StAR-related lipid transfer protein 3 [Hondaea fermentalgiana]|eukprot:GBG34368.1 StAR-related lipid transfer protein 3 [Hondaea fermentalgiana]